MLRWEARNDASEQSSTNNQREEQTRIQSSC